MSIDNATGKLLVATPRTGGKVFRRSVVLVLQHDEDGAQGVVLNHPLGAPVSAVLPSWHDYVTHPSNVFQGGPVSLDSAMGLVTVPGDQQQPTEKVVYFVHTQYSPSELSPMKTSQQ